ncbi:unnamed protein product (macronuclear) [Paramecium tetraurelia]|uniref:GAF domain-containing protein n=1 Tax=Paramecium tetraurelia TaxID=5888 RepID=A0CYW4_PARTE|nr:uncharacterized protein GSPATT00011582001 [Paramecium tetraurelia]CAK75981.1 unnamed protein product [Paramecium tetraurelia]|eukprot:XP_001443378.1 hypothetical protein (macronuclear) [Paramecium tetraurelia strain d4-2]
MSSFYNHQPRRKHSQTSFYLKTLHCQPSPIKDYNKDNTQQEYLQNMLRMQQKEIERLEHQNRNLQILTEHQSKIIYQERQNRTHFIPKIQDKDTMGSQQIINKQRVENPLDKPIRLQRKNTINRKLTVLFQQDDTFKLNSLLDLNITDEELINNYQTDGSLSLIEETLNDEDCFLDVIHNYPPQKVSIIYDKLKKLYHEHNLMFHIILKLKLLIQKGFMIQNSKLLDESFQILRESILTIMNSQEVKIYLIDEEKKELYSRQDNHKYQIGEGLVGYVAETKQILNLKKAKYDTRFAPIDSNVILAAPILDNQKCYGVIVCQEKKNAGIYSEEDESLLQLLSEQGKMILCNVMNHNQLMTAVNKFRHALKSSIQFIQLKSQTLLIQQAQKRLKEMMNSEIATIKLVEHIDGQGIMGEAILNKSITYHHNSYNSQSFNPNIDLNTSLPIFTLPVICNKQVVACAQFTQVRGLVQQSSLSSIEQEVLELFLQSFGYLISK